MNDVLHPASRFTMMTLKDVTFYYGYTKHSRGLLMDTCTSLIRPNDPTLDPSCATSRKMKFYILSLLSNGNKCVGVPGHATGNGEPMNIRTTMSLLYLRQLAHGVIALCLLIDTSMRG